MDQLVVHFLELDHRNRLHSVEMDRQYCLCFVDDYHSGGLRSDNLGS